jgi:hypothetical protein
MTFVKLCDIVVIGTMDPEDIRHMGSCLFLLVGREAGRDVKY